MAPDVAPRGAAIVADFRAVYTPFDGFGGRVPTVTSHTRSRVGWIPKISIEGLHVDTQDVNGGTFLTVVDHRLWHGWYEWIATRRMRIRAQRGRGA